MNWNEWRNDKARKPRTQNWYTDGPIPGTNPGVSVYEKKQSYKVCEPPGRNTTVLQTEIYLTQTCALESLHRQPVWF